MNVTYLVGNGFDLNLGLNTMYRSFIDKYISINNNDDAITFFKKQIAMDKVLWANAEEALGFSTKAFKEKGYTEEDFINCQMNFGIELSNYLIKEEHKIKNLNNKIAEILGSALGDITIGFREGEKNRILEDISKIPGGYVFNVVDFNYTRIIDNAYKYLNNNKQFISRRTYERQSYMGSLGKLYHIHGTVEKDMVIGVNDVDQIGDISLFSTDDDLYLNYLIKPLANKEYDENIDDKVYGLLKQSDILYIYGMSLGKTDKQWWERICNLMIQKPKLHVIIHNYAVSKEQLFSLEKRKQDREIKNTFVSYCEISDEEKNSIKNRIHIPEKNIFYGLENLVAEEKRLA